MKEWKFFFHKKEYNKLFEMKILPNKVFPPVGPQRGGREIASKP
jgi:hypothetical protein